VDKNAPIETILKLYLDDEEPTQNRINESILLARLGEAANSLEKITDMLKEGRSLEDPKVRDDMADTINSVRMLLYGVGQIITKKQGP
jgi:hypothetical protein